MTPKQMALSQLARRALSAASELPPSGHAEVCILVAAALHDDCPDLAALARTAAARFNAATETETELISLIPPP